MTETVAWLSAITGSGHIAARGDKLMQKLNERHGYRFLLYSSKTFQRAVTGTFDLVIACAPVYFALGYYLSRIHGIPLINDFRDPYTLFYSRKLFPRMCLLHRNLADAISVTMRAYVDEYRLDAQKVFYSPNAAPIEWTELPKREPEQQICFVGSLGNRMYNFPLMFSAFRHLTRRYPKMNLVITGDGPLLPELQRMAMELEIGSRVRFLGQIPYDDVALVISRSLFGLALNPWLGLKEIEYGACGRPCLSLRGTIESEGVPWIVTADPTPRHLAETMAWLVSDAEARETLGETGRKRVRQFYNWDTMADMWHHVIRRLIG